VKISEKKIQKMRKILPRKFEKNSEKFDKKFEKIYFDRFYVFGNYIRP